MPPPIHRMLPSLQADLDSFMVRSHLLGMLARRILGVVVGLAVLKNGKSTSTVLRSAPVPLGDRFDSSSSSTGGDESHARSGAERRCVRLFAGSSEGEFTANRRQLCQGPRPASSLRAAPAKQGMEAARSAAVGADIAHFLNSLEGHKNAKLASDAPRSAPVPLAEGCDGWAGGQKGGMGFSCGAARSAAAFLCLKRLTWRKKCANRRQCGRGSGAKRRYRCVFDSRQLHGQKFSKSTPNAPRLAPSILVHRLDEPTETVIQPPFSSHFSAQGAPSSTALGDEYMYRHPPSEAPPPSNASSGIDRATLLEPYPPLATPTILVSTNFNISQPLGTEIT
ncbi:hypothetical protein EV714DRAFT_278372 [Schizophyllum commune]